MRGLSFLTSTFKCCPRIALVLAAIFSIGEIAPAFHCVAYGQIRQNQDKAVQADADSKARRPSRAWRRDTTASRMRKLSTAMDLLTLGEVPVVGDLPNGLPTNPGLQIFADRLTLYLHPEILRPDVKVADLAIRKMAIRLLGNSATKPYITNDGKDWRGDDEFQRKRSKDAFYQESVRVLKRLALKPPFRFRTVNRAGVGEYDFGNERFEIDWRGDQKAGALRLSFTGTKQQKLLENLTLPQSLTFPKYWKMKPGKAEQLSTLLRSVDNRNRSVYVSTIFDVIDRSDPDDKPNGQAQWGARFEMRPRHSAVFADIECKNKLWEFPLVLPPAGILVSRDLLIPKPDPLYLWQPEVQVALAADVKAEAIERSDWLAAALSVYQEDMEYYKNGTMVPREIQGSDRARLLSSLQTSKQPSNWDDSYLPFFPRGFFGGGRLDVASISRRSIRNSQIEFLKRWMKSRIAAAGGEFLLECQIRVDRENNVASLIPGASTKESLELDFPNRKDFGHIGRLKSLRGNTDRSVADDGQSNRFSVVYPALAYHMNFAIDAATLPPARNNETIQIYGGDLVVKMGEIQWVNSDADSHVLLHINPVRFEALRPLPQGGVANKRAGEIAKVDFRLPVSIAQYNEHDLARDQAAAKALEVAKQAEIEQERIAQREKLLQEQEAKRQKVKADLARKREAEKQNRSLNRERERIRRLQERGQIDQEQADAMLQQQVEMEQGKERVKLAREEALLKSNELLQQGYSHEQIDWETGTLRPEVANAEQGIRTWPLLLALLTACIGLLAVIGWRWRRGSLGDDVTRLKEQVFGSSRTYQPRSLNRRLAKIDIPNAKMKLGKAMYHQGVGEEEFSNIYRELRQIYAQLAKFQSELPSNQTTDLGDSSSENALATFYATSQGMALELQNQLAESKLKSRRRAAFTYLADRLIESPSIDPRRQFDRQIENIRMMYDQMLGSD